MSNLHRAFVANISHELRTPLNSIIAFNSLLIEDETLGEAQREFVASAIVSAEALLGIIGQILDFAKLESGSEVHQELVIESFDVNDVMNELVDIVGHQANKNQVELVLDIDPSLDGLVVRGDKFRLRQALINVTNNSIKYTREGGEVRIRVDCLAQAPRRPRADARARASAWLTGSHADHTSLATTSTEPPSADDFGDDDHAPLVSGSASRLWTRASASPRIRSGSSSCLSGRRAPAARASTEARGSASPSPATSSARSAGSSRVSRRSAEARR